VQRITDYLMTMRLQQRSLGAEHFVFTAGVLEEVVC
jgi:hypothetical protein